MPDSGHTSTIESELSEQQQERLAQILDTYLQGIERGEPMSPEQLLEQHPEEASYLRGYLSGLKLFHQAAAAPATEAATRFHPEILGSQDTIGDFRLIRILGRGGMGVVYEAWQCSLQRKVALKVLPFTGNDDSVEIRRFKNEAQAAANIAHPHIVPVFSIGEEAGIHFYTMRLIEGPSLASLLDHLRVETIACHGETTAVELPADYDNCDHDVDRQQRDTELAIVGLNPSDRLSDRLRSVARLGAEAADALHAAHECGIVHRDVKPSNLLISNDGKLWITDFGLARCRDRDCNTQTGDIIGTMRYMSPEQARGQGDLVDHRTDIYSLGVTLYELATLNHPCPEVANPQWIIDGRRPVAKPLRSWNKHIPRDFETIVMKAISDEPGDRYRTALEFAEDLRRFEEGMPIKASPPSLLNRASKWARRHQRLATAAAMLIALLFAGQSFNNLLLANKNAEIASKNVAIDQALVSSEQNLRQALEVLDRFGARTVDQLAAIPGAEGLRFELLKDSLDYYNQFEGQVDPTSPTFDNIARAYSNMGMLSERLGETEVALTRYSTARQLWQQKLAADGNAPDSVLQLAKVCNRLALLLIQESRLDEADSSLRQAEQTLATKPIDQAKVPSNLVQLAVTKNNRGLWYKAKGNISQAIDCFEQSIHVLNHPQIEQSNDEDELRCLAASYNNLASLGSEVEFDQARRAYAWAIDIQRKLVALAPTNRLYQGELARTYSNLGYFLAQHQHWGDAKHSFRNAISIQQLLVQASPAAISYRRDWAISYNNLGMTQARVGEYQQALESFEQAYKIEKMLLNVVEQDPKLLSDLGSVCNNLGLLFQEQHDFQRAETAYAEALRYQRNASLQVPGSSSYRELVENHADNYVHCLLSQDKAAEADKLIDEQQAWGTSQVAAAKSRPAGSGVGKP
ncbi:tetratricopeptide repeat-containing serine/threonine-protein kinase [Aeoliella mucimassa]|uniref:Serine/threonine-protein kinase PrkC n=1 Tax=Aeoliella mucimassa TaxID=2527972 RepID=A0A518AN16_9BACT|nr:tetratricopeptide repeat-containing serine/threonine-protein kinase [Aeoliella mucimassa]QDU56113.1 Serine/threonine-protein kinase PrkC [Aeoliella mucimassa]